MALQCGKIHVCKICSQLLIVLLLTLLSTPVLSSEGALKCEAYGVVVRVVDGDTVDVSNITYYDELIEMRVDSSRARVRFADVNAPELGTPEGELARKALAELVESYDGLVCLDIDSMRTLDPYGRVIAVVYLRVNETHFLNLNKWLLINNYAEVRDFTDNEFNPDTWELYIVFSVETPGRTVTPSKTPLVAIWEYILEYGVMLAVIIVVIAALATYAARPKRRVGRRSRAWR